MREYLTPWSLKAIICEQNFLYKLCRKFNMENCPELFDEDCEQFTLIYPEIISVDSPTTSTLSAAEQKNTVESSSEILSPTGNHEHRIQK